MISVNRAVTNEILRITQGTWGAARHWNVRVGRDGKRTYVYKLQGPPWSSRPKEMEATDTIGTKAVLHWQKGSFSAAAQDAAAMTVDDAIEYGYVTYKMQNNILIETDSPERGRPAIRSIVAGLARIAKRHRFILTGGETAIINTIKGFELGTTSTAVKLYDGPSGLTADSILIGLKSSGIHSNGFTFINDLYFKKLKRSPRDKLAGVGRLIDVLTTPTTIYMDELAKLLKAGGSRVHGMVHITGGGWSKLRELDPNCRFDIEVESVVPKDRIFSSIYEDSRHARIPISQKEMFTKFNCGIGYIVAVDPDYEGEALNILRPHSPTALNARIRKAPHGRRGQVSIVNNTFGPSGTLKLK